MIKIYKTQSRSVIHRTAAMSPATWIVSFIFLVVLNITDGRVCSYGGGFSDGWGQEINVPMIPPLAMGPVPPMPLMPYANRDNDLKEFLPWLILFMSGGGIF